MKESVPALTQVLHVAHMLEARLEQDLADVGLSLAKHGVLSALAASSEPMALGAIADSVGCVRSNVTQLVDRLEADGLVRRVADPSDRRVTRAELTPDGRRSHADAVGIVARHEAAAAEAVGSDLATLSKVLARLSR